MGLLAIFLLIGDFAFTSVFDGFRGKAYDLYQMAAPREADLSPFMLVEVDDEALAKVGRWPWSRDKIAELIEKIGDAGPKAFAVDILFPETENELADARLTAAIAAARPVLAMSLGEYATRNPPAEKIGWSVVGQPPEELTTFPGLLASLPQLTDAAGGLGVVRSVPDADGVTRSVPLVWATQGAGGIQFWPALSLDLVRQVLGDTAYTVRLSPQGYSAIRTGERIIDLTAGSAIWLTDTHASLPRTGALSILDGSAIAQLTGKIVILSVAATGFDSFHTTALVATRPGAEIHALLASQILGGVFPYEPPHAKTAERTAFIALAALMLVAALLFNSLPILSVIALPLLLASPLAIGFYAYGVNHMLFDAVRPTLAMAILAGGGGYFLYRAAEERRRRISGQFAQYLSPDVVDRLVRSGADIGQSAEKREVTVLFMDMRGFTSASERLTQEDIVETVNSFFTIASAEIFRTEGTIDKFMGDAVMAFWNAPLDQPDHRLRAFNAIRRIFQELGEENTRRLAAGKEPIRIGAGVESGICAVGNFGSDIRYNYTVIGQAANLASRLETATKRAGIPALAGPGFREGFEGELAVAGEFHLEGVGEAVTVYRLPL